LEIEPIRRDVVQIARIFKEGEDPLSSDREFLRRVEPVGGTVDPVKGE
jgi:hypothetical protein